ncbi:penicillin-binding transpeptidase domain-containing protein [Halomonas sp. HP20-15]|uniref:peptidoglycan D,D-transpeptidase FtsI family protein n=1 Tax=Halomonas sp. HP20-15 TaxID=3085901 RepID=UPI002982661A|nr:penicillin-binding transpeptidase domain-containing protein [Halomonas sp. HP20-15]MDW5378658.1 penicillin-binding transpeptidase domain-containing protein [Halomonas sp. HP20-15]
MSQRSGNPNNPTRAEVAPLGSGRFRFMLVVLVVAMLVLIGRIVDLHVLDRMFLQGQGDARTLRVETIDAHRGMISDRHGDPLAISTPVVTLWANPQELPSDDIQRMMLARALGIELDDLNARIERYADHEFMYLRRRMTPTEAQKITDLHVPGVYVQHEYKRYYPSGEVTAQLVGVTNVDDRGQEGLELAYNGYLTGTPGKRRVLKDRKGRLVRDLHLIKEAKPGGELTLAIDLRLQYMAYRELKAAVDEHNADGGTVVMMDARTGEILAMVNAPSYNPNNRADLDIEGLRNQAVTDAFEPGSVMKPLAMSAALESDQFSPDTVIDTSPGYMRVDEYTINDFRNYGKLDMGGILLHSSNVGMSRVALRLPEDAIWQRYHELGLGQAPETGFPGEATGSLPTPYNWSDSKRATMAYGYGVAVSALQLASAYTAIANQGRQLSPSLLKLNGQEPKGKPVIEPQVASNLLGMMEKIVQPGAGGARGMVPGYRVAGKTGTVRKVGSTGYQTTAYRSLFAGIAPVSDPRIVTVVMIDNAKGQEYYGGLVAAPVFSRVVGKALRLLDVLPDKKEALE